MKPASLVTIILRLSAIYLFFYTLSVSFTPLIVTRLIFQGSPISQSSLLGGFPTIYVTLAAFALVVSILLYIWSRALGRLIAKGLD